MTVLFALLVVTTSAQDLRAPFEAKPPQEPVYARAQRPVPRTPPIGWLTLRDYPKAARDAHQQGKVAFRLTVDATGMVVNCTITESSGFPSLDDQTCRMMRLRARFEPAQDGSGNAIPFTWSSFFVWKL